MSVHVPYEVGDSRWFGYEQGWKAACLACLNRLIPVEERGQTTVFDFGSGRGEMLRLLVQAGYAAQGGDFDPECVRLSNRFAPANLMSDEALRQGALPPRAFDVVMAIHVLEHLRNPADTVERLKVASRRYVLLVVPNLQSTALSCRRRLYVANEGHVCGWDYPHFRNFLEKICRTRVLELIGDTVPLMTGYSRLDHLLERTLGKDRIARLESGTLLRRLPYLSHSIIAACSAHDS